MNTDMNTDMYTDMYTDMNSNIIADIRADLNTGKRHRPSFILQRRSSFCPDAAGKRRRLWGSPSSTALPMPRFRS